MTHCSDVTYLVHLFGIPKNVNPDLVDQEQHLTDDFFGKTIIVDTNRTWSQLGFLGP